MVFDGAYDADNRLSKPNRDTFTALKVSSTKDIWRSA
jgi:hypothetical protein